MSYKKKKIDVMEFFPVLVNINLQETVKKKSYTVFLVADMCNLLKRIF